jgi:hypothetical protein
LSEEKKQQVIALGKLGWPLRRIEQVTGVRRETASVYLKSAGVVVCLPGWGRRAPAKPAIGVTTDSGQSISPPTTQQDLASSVCEPYRALIEQGLGHGEKRDIFKEMTVFTRNVICEVIFGQEQSLYPTDIANSVSAAFEKLRAEILYLSLLRKLPFPRSRHFARMPAVFTNSVISSVSR